MFSRIWHNSPRKASDERSLTAGPGSQTLSNPPVPPAVLTASATRRRTRFLLTAPPCFRRETTTASVSECDSAGHTHTTRCPEVNLRPTRKIRSIAAFFALATSGSVLPGLSDAFGQGSPFPLVSAFGCETHGSFSDGAYSAGRFFSIDSPSTAAQNLAERKVRWLESIASRTPMHSSRPCPTQSRRSQAHFTKSAPILFPGKSLPGYTLRALAPFPPKLGGGWPGFLFPRSISADPVP